MKPIATFPRQHRDPRAWSEGHQSAEETMQPVDVARREAAELGEAYFRCLALLSPDSALILEAKRLISPIYYARAASEGIGRPGPPPTLALTALAEALESRAAE